MSKDTTPRSVTGHDGLEIIVVDDDAALLEFADESSLPKIDAGRREYARRDRGDRVDAGAAADIAGPARTMGGAYAGVVDPLPSSDVPPAWLGTQPPPSATSRKISRGVGLVLLLALGLGSHLLIDQMNTNDLELTRRALAVPPSEAPRVPRQAAVDVPLAYAPAAPAPAPEPPVAVAPPIAVAPPVAAAPQIPSPARRPLPPSQQALLPPSSSPAPPVTTPAPAPARVPESRAAVAPAPRPAAEPETPATARREETATAPAVPPPAPAAERVTVQREEIEIRRLLDAYRDAYDRLDAVSTARLWPGVDTAGLQRAFSSLASQQLEFDDCNLDVLGQRATARCRGSVQYVRRVGRTSPQSRELSWDFELDRTSGRWLITRVTAQ